MPDLDTLEYICSARRRILIVVTCPSAFLRPHSCARCKLIEARIIPFRPNLEVPLQLNMTPSREPLGEVILFGQVRCLASLGYVSLHVGHLGSSTLAGAQRIEPHDPSVGAPADPLQELPRNRTAVNDLSSASRMSSRMVLRRWRLDVKELRRVHSLPWKEVEIEKQHLLAWQL